ncbi:hypothetical protein D9757_004745 [Collybiopsis confluens]|uniref:Dystroglycan-type cadherin-like domain-containing protein n=1 Tax=Collybiopsis confluens TaxID=2823264 RepID=A0A8H5HSZ0_9AGAR|nr:hypothetical protein D9757_004745 [Collybiopsis confluens]
MLSHFLSLILALASIPFTTSLSVQISLDDQYPLVAHVGEFYSWTISSRTFNYSSDSSMNYTASPLPTWLNFNANNGTFYGIPSKSDQGEPAITITADDGDDSASTSCNILVTTDSAIIPDLPISSQFYDSNPSMSSVFFLSKNSALYTGVPTLRVPHRWSFSIGFADETFVDDGDDVHYMVLQQDASPVPYKMEFSPGPNTFGGVAPRLDEVGPLSRFSFELRGLISDKYTDGSFPFDLVIADHEFSIDSNSLPTVNITRAANFTIKLGSSNDIAGVQIDGKAVNPSDISMYVNTSGYNWLNWDSEHQLLTGNSEGQNFDSSTGPRLPVTLMSDFNQTIQTVLPLAIEPSFFTVEAFPLYSIPDSGSVWFDIQQYLSNATGEQPADVNMSITTEPSSSASCLALNASSMILGGTVTGDCAASNISVTIAAYSRVTHSTSHATLPMTYPQFKQVTGSPRHGGLSFAAHKKLVLGLCISLGIVGGLSALGTFLASVRRCLRVQDPVLVTEQCQRNLSESDKRWYGLGEDRAGYGWNHESTLPPEKARLGLELTRSPRNYGNIGLGLDPLTRSRTNELMSSSSIGGNNLQIPGVMKKGDFMNRMRETVRNVSDKFGSHSRRKARGITRGVIGKPILLNAREGTAPPVKAIPTRALIDEAGNVSTPASVHFADLTRQLSTDSTSSTASIRTHANEAVVQTASRRPAIPNAIPSRPRLKQVASAMRVPPPKSVSSSSENEGSASGSVLSARVTSQKAKIWKGSDEAAVSSSTDDMFMGIRYVTAWGGDTNDADSRIMIDSVSAVDPDVRPGSSYTVSTRHGLQSTYSLSTADHDRSTVERRIVRADERFEILVAVGMAKRLEAQLISGDPTPKWMEFDLRPRNGKIEVYGLASIADVGEWDVRILDLANGNAAFAMHRDAFEWTKFREIFAEEGYVVTSWSKGKTIDEFIQISRTGFERGDRIMHKVLGTSVEVKGHRGLGKCKGIITQRFQIPCEQGGKCEVDVECQTRFWFWVEKNESGEWKAYIYKGTYEKDKMIPVDPRKIPAIDDAKLATYPYGYRYLGYAQGLQGHDINMNLPQAVGEQRDAMYLAQYKWLDEHAPISEVFKILDIERKTG